jgi:hypothetical protein
MDGNGRLSRYIIQEALRLGDVTEPGLIQPVSNGVFSDVNA